MKSLVRCWIYSGSIESIHSIHASKTLMGVKKLVAVVVNGCGDGGL